MDKRYIILAIAIALVAAYVVYDNLTKQSVTVQGTVTTKGFTTSPNSVTFQLSNGGQKSTAPVDESGFYSVKLDAPRSYDVIVSYADAAFGGTCRDKITLKLDPEPNPRIFDIKC